MTRRLNPFAQRVSDNPSAENGRHVTDDPGRDHDQTSSDAPERTRSSGPSSPSERRCPGGETRQAPLGHEAGPIIPGEILHGDGDVIINEGLEVTTLRVANTSDRPIQIGSHFHSAEVNAALEFDRDAAWGKRLAVLSGEAERFEPGAVLEVNLIPIQGRRIALGLRGLCKAERGNAKG